MTDVVGMVADWLKRHKYDGLYNPECCACLIDDLAPCGEMQNECRPGYRADCSDACGCEHYFYEGAWPEKPWHVQKERPTDTCTGQPPSE